MGSAKPITPFTHEDFLLWETTQSIKHEFVRGEVFAMVGALRVHVTVTGNVIALLKAHLKGSPCRAFASDMLVRVEAVDSNFYPDIVVTCDANDKIADRIMTSPTLMVEVLSESTEAFDRGGKFEAYRHIQSLKEYVLIDPDRTTLECYRLNKDSRWELHDFQRDSKVSFARIDFQADWAEIFAEL